MERYRDYYYPSNNDRLRIKGSPSPSFPLSVKSDEKYQLSAADCTKGRRLMDCVTRLVRFPSRGKPRRSAPPLSGTLGEAHLIAVLNKWCKLERFASLKSCSVRRFIHTMVWTPTRHFRDVSPSMRISNTRDSHEISLLRETFLSF